MPTPPSGHQPHQYRQIAESFGTDAERYDRARPRYPDALITRLLAETDPAGSTLRVLDAGSGTGIVARQLQATGCQVLGVEPDARMAALARSLGVDTEVATLESWDPAGRRFDLMVAGQAWHWIDPAAGADKAARALRPGGRLAVFWNSLRPPAALARACAEAYRRALPDLPFDPAAMADRSTDDYGPLLDKAADGIARTGLFEEPQRWRFTWEQHYTRDQWLDQLPTTGALTRSTPEQQAQVLQAAGAAVDRLGGTFTMNCTTVAITTRRTNTPDA